MQYRRRTWYDWVRGQNGDAILFTEALCHGGVKNHKNETRMTLHVGYGPYWMMSQNIATMDESLFINQKLGNVIIPNKKNYSNLGYDKARNIN